MMAEGAGEVKETSSSALHHPLSSLFPPQSRSRRPDRTRVALVVPNLARHGPWQR